MQWELASNLYSCPKVYHRLHKLKRTEAEFFSRLAQKPGILLELGCGGGRLYPCLGKGQATYVGLDVSIPMLDYFRSLYPEVTLVEANWASIPLRPAVLTQIVIARNTWFHVRQEEEDNLIQQLSDLLTSAGQIVLEVDDVSTMGPKYQTAWKDLTVRSLFQIQRLFERHGLLHLGNFRLSQYQIALQFARICR